MTRIAITLLLWAIPLWPIIIHAAETPEHNTAIENPANATGFQPVDLNTVERINGKSLAIIAYGIIFGVFIFYTLSLLKRERALEKEARQLEKQIGKAA